MAYQSIGVTIHQNIHQVTAYDIFQTIYKIGRINAWRDLTQLTILFLLAEYAGNIRVRRAEYYLFLGVLP